MSATCAHTPGTVTIGSHGPQQLIAPVPGSRTASAVLRGRVDRRVYVWFSAERVYRLSKFTYPAERGAQTSFVLHSCQTLPSQFTSSRTRRRPCRASQTGCFRISARRRFGFCDGLTSGILAAGALIRYRGTQKNALAHRQAHETAWAMRRRVDAPQPGIDAAAARAPRCRPSTGPRYAYAARLIARPQKIDDQR